ncbi:MAG: hypothetical protein WBA74_20970 [Cyclobacteriaceae bacterium]
MKKLFEISRHADLLVREAFLIYDKGLYRRSEPSLDHLLFIPANAIEEDLLSVDIGYSLKIDTTTECQTFYYQHLTIDLKELIN